MPITAWIVTPNSPDLLPEILERLLQERALLLAPPEGPRLPLVMDTSSPAEERALLKRLQHELSGQATFDLVCAHFDDAHTPEH